ncbi:MAG: VWA domain-containing protein [Deltaproteobacteria bacterium]|nr:VWA domain-containing protein [Candidatus Tharpella sp.]
MGFEYPYALFLFLPLLWFGWRWGKIPTVNFASALIFADDLRPDWWQVNLLRLLAYAVLVCLIMACANYRYAETREQSYRESRWLMLVQDLSGSMHRPSGVAAGETFADVALDGLSSFVKRRPAEDMIGLVAFSSFARLLAPLTFDRPIIYDKIKQLDRRDGSRLTRQLAVGGATNASYAVWLAMSAFFMMLPQESRPSFAELKELRYLLSGKNRAKVAVPAKLQGFGLERGVAIILFTDGRIKVSRNGLDQERGLPDFVSLVRFLERVGIRLYIIAVDGNVGAEVVEVLKDAPGRLFLMPGRFSRAAMHKIYSEINGLEKNRQLSVYKTVPRSTRSGFALAGLCFFVLYSVIGIIPKFVRW